MRSENNLDERNNRLPFPNNNISNNKKSMNKIFSVKRNVGFIGTKEKTSKTESFM